MENVPERSQRTEIEIFGRKLSVQIEGLAPVEVNELVQLVHQKMANVSDNNPQIADTSKLALLAAIDLAADVRRLRRLVGAGEGATPTFVPAVEVIEDLEQAAESLNRARHSIEKSLRTARGEQCQTTTSKRRK